MKSVLVLGATNIDIIAKSHNKLVLHDKNPGTTTISYGGVARNICENLARLQLNPSFMTIIGNDHLGISAINYLEKINTKVTYETINSNTPTFLSILDNDGDNYIAISSMDALNQLEINKLKINFNNYDLIVFDTNIIKFIDLIKNCKKPVFVDATSEAKCVNIKNYLNYISYLKCTREELLRLFDTFDLSSIINMYPNLSLIITNKSEDITYNIGKELFTSPVIKQEVISSIGAGDSFSAGIIYGLSKSYSMHKCIEIAKIIAGKTVTISEAVNPNLSLDLIKGVEDNE